MSLLVMDTWPGRDEALSRLFEAHYSDMVRLAFYLTGSWAVGEELGQEAFVRLWRRWGGLRDQHAAVGYLRATVVNLSRSAVSWRWWPTPPGSAGSGAASSVWTSSTWCPAS